MTYAESGFPSVTSASGNVDSPRTVWTSWLPSAFNREVTAVATRLRSVTAF